MIGDSRREYRQPNAAAPGAPSREIFVGSVERVTFHNEENGFAVLKVTARGRRELVTVVGHVASISAGEYIHAVARCLTSPPRPAG